MGLLSSRFNRPESGAIHSNAIASASPGTFGSTSAETFGQRKSIDSRRVHVQNFRHAGVIHAYQQHAATVRQDTSSTDSSPSRQRSDIHIPTRQAFNTRLIAHQSPSIESPPASKRIEPPSRGYNPYA